MRSALLIVCRAALAASLSACNLIGPDQSVVLGVTNVAAPPTVAAGATFTVTLTVQVGGCTAFDRIEVQSDATGARLIPWGTNSSIGRKGIACPTDIRYEPHAAQVKAGGSDPFYVDVDQGRLAPIRATVRVQ